MYDKKKKKMFNPYIYLQFTSFFIFLLQIRQLYLRTLIVLCDWSAVIFIFIFSHRSTEWEGGPTSFGDLMLVHHLHMHESRGLIIRILE